MPLVANNESTHLTGILGCLAKFGSSEEIIRGGWAGKEEAIHETIR